MSNHPLYLQRVDLVDGRSGTVVDVYDDGEAFMVEVDGANDSMGWHALPIVTPDEIAGGRGVLARHHKSIMRLESGQGFTLDLGQLSEEEFAAFLTMSNEERKATYGDYHSFDLSSLSRDQHMAFLTSVTFPNSKATVTKLTGMTDEQLRRALWGDDA